MVHTIASAENLIKNIIDMNRQISALYSNLNSRIEMLKIDTKYDNLFS